MGAPAREWAVRSAAACAVAALVGVMFLGAWPLLWKCVALALLGVSGSFLAFRFIPGFDPLGRVRWRLRCREAGTWPPD